jgi:O26-antigen biosynthesis N-acetyl-L-fucosamine transferase
MRILLIVVYYPPSTTSAARMMRELALEYVRQGHEVIVATPSDAIEGRMHVAEEDGATVVRIRTGDIRGSRRIIRMWHEGRLSATIWNAGEEFFRTHRCDLIVFYSPPIFFGGLVHRLKALWGCPSYLILRDIFPKWALEVGVLRQGLSYRYLKRREQQQYTAADRIGAEAPGDLAYFDDEECGGRFQVEVLYNWLDAGERLTGRSGWRQRLQLDDKVVFFYGGNIGIAQDLNNLLRLASSLQDRDNIFFLLMGSGSEAERVNAEIESRALQNMRLYPPIAQDEYMECLSEFDAGLVSLDRRLKSNNFTGKLLGYVFCGKPILASVRAGHDLIGLLQHTGAGVACANGDDESLRASALLLASDSGMRKRMGGNARALASTIFSVRSAARQILSHFPCKASEVEAVTPELRGDGSPAFYRG